MSAMTQTEWAARVAEIGKLAGWHKEASAFHQESGPSFSALSWMDQGKQDPAAIAAIHQLCADWLGQRNPPVVANRVCRWRCVGDGNWQCDCGHTAPYMQVAKWHFCPACGGKNEVTA
jgi:membrane protease subunit (stomatin/prohibitin family)